MDPPQLDPQPFFEESKIHPANVGTSSENEKSGASPSNVRQVGEDTDTEDDVHRDTAELEPTVTTKSVYPEGGLSGWLVVAGAWFALFASVGMMNSLAALQAYILSHQLKDYSESTVGWIFSLYVFVGYLPGIYVGPIFDKYGPKWLVSIGIGFTVSGMLAMSFSTKLWHFFASFSILCGLGYLLVFTPSFAAIGHFFKLRRGVATGVASTAGGVGGICVPFMLSSLFKQVGWGWTIRAVCLVFLVCGVLGILLVRTRLQPAQNASPHPDLRIFKQIPFTLTTIGIFLLEFAVFIPLTYITSYAIHEGLGEDFAYYLLSILNAASIVGRAIPGYLADKVGVFNTVMAAALLSAVSCLAIWLPFGSSTAGVVVFCVLFGIASGTVISVTPVCVGQLCKTQEYGRYCATAYAAASFACLIGIPTGGAIIQANGGEYYGLIITTGMVYLGAFVVFYAIKMTVHGWRNWKAKF